MIRPHDSPNEVLMADDDIEPNDESGGEAADEEVEADLDEEELDEDSLVGEPDEEEFEADDLPEEDDELDEDVADDDADDTEGTTRVRKRKTAVAEDEEEDDDDDLLTPDDVEADLDRILKDRMVAAEDEEDEEDEESPVDDRGEALDGLQPKRADEMLCSSCFLLVRPNAPGCPVEDDNCPIFH
jgi:hypothetical protein